MYVVTNKPKELQVQNYMKLWRKIKVFDVYAICGQKIWNEKVHTRNYPCEVQNP